jgi:hypothetical protein
VGVLAITEVNGTALVQDGISISDDVKKWEQQEAARKAAALRKVMQLKALRDSQVQEKEERLQRVGALHLPSLREMTTL